MFVYRMIWFLLQPLLKIFFRFTVQGRKQIPSSGPVLLAANHNTYLDPPLIALGVWRHISYIAKKELFDIPVLNSVIRWFGTHPVARGQGDTKAVKTALRILREGKVLLMFPEGTRSSDGNLQPLEPGTAWLSLKTGAPVVPICLLGTNRALPRKALFPRPYRIRMLVGSPVVPKIEESKKVEQEDVLAMTQQIAQALIDLKTSRKKEEVKKSYSENPII